jgi:hypothetical protein
MAPTILRAVDEATGIKCLGRSFARRALPEAGVAATEEKPRMTKKRRSDRREKQLWQDKEEAKNGNFV